MIVIDIFLKSRMCYNNLKIINRLMMKRWYTYLGYELEIKN